MQLRFYKKVDKFVEKFEKIIDAPITITANKLKVSKGGVEFTLQSDGADLKVDVNFGKKKSINLGVLGKGKVCICAGVNIIANMENGPYGTIKNGKSETIEQDKLDYAYYTSDERIFELIELY